MNATLEAKLGKASVKAEADLLKTLEWLEGRKAELVRDLGRFLGRSVPEGFETWVGDRERELAYMQRRITSVRLALNTLED